LIDNDYCYGDDYTGQGSDHHIYQHILCTLPRFIYIFYNYKM